MNNFLLTGFCIFITIGCCSCDYDVDLREKNFSWSDRSTDSVYLHAKGYHFTSDGNPWAAIVWEGKAQRTHENQIVFLCLSGNAECSGVYNLNKGFVVWTKYLSEPNYQQFLNLSTMKSESFYGAKQKDGSVLLKYNGEVTAVSNSENGLANWLQFNVEARENMKKVQTLAQKLYSMLEQEPNAKEILPCLKQLHSN